ncbi:MAG: 50S ribosomal protein L15 [Planctomycetota bacterium]|jgi:large subunit ribosomal protein L15
MNIAEITRLAGAHKRRKRVGRGRAAGQGKTCGRGHNGGGSRSGWRQRGFAAGGQMPLFRRLPKRGFNNANFRTEYSVVNVADLGECFEDGTHVTPQLLVEAGLVRDLKRGIKILGDGTLSEKLVVEASRFSKQAAEKIAAAGGEIKVV